MPVCPEQIANGLKLAFPEDGTMRISHEAIYQVLFIRVPRARTRGRGKPFVIPEIMITERLADIVAGRCRATGKVT